MLDSDGKNESFVRWQGRSLEYLSYSINLFLGLSIAAIGFEINMLRDPSFIPDGWIRDAYLISLLLLIASSGFGIGCVINRIRDFRDTATLAKNNSKNKNCAEINELRLAVGIIGSRTRVLFDLQIFLFSFGVLLLILVILGFYVGKIF